MLACFSRYKKVWDCPKFSKVFEVYRVPVRSPTFSYLTLEQVNPKVFAIFQFLG